MKLNKTNIKQLLLASLIVIFAVSCNSKPEDPNPTPSFEQQFCHKWECWKISYAEMSRELAEDEVYYMTFLEDGKLLFESSETDEVEIYHWTKQADDSISILIPSPTADLSEVFEQIPLIEIDASFFRDTITLNAQVSELTDTTAVLSGDIMWRDMFTLEAAERLENSMLKNMLNSKIKSTLYLRKEASATVVEE